MNPEYLQNIRYKLQKRVWRLNSTRFDLFYNASAQFWKYLKNNPIFTGILDDLSIRFPEANKNAEDIIQRNQVLHGESEEEQAAISYFVFENYINSKNRNVPWDVGHHYDRAASKTYEALDVFRELFLEPLYEYVDEKLDEQRAILSLLIRYKHKCEWFARESLFRQWEQETQKGESILAYNLYEYLHDQGINFYIEPSSASGKIDLIGDQRGTERLVADAKIFNPEKEKGKSYLAKGFNQIYIYTQDYNEPFGYLVIFKTSEKELHINLKESEQSVPFLTFNHKTIFLLTIDIYPHDTTASTRGVLEPIKIAEEDLIKEINE